MKRLFRRTVVLFLACLCVFSFSSCKNGIKGDEAKAYINDFFAAIVDEDYDKAKSLIHPSINIDLEAYLLRVEQEEGIDFQAGIEIKRYTGFYNALYDSEVDGSAYELTMIATVGDRTVEIEVEIVKNDQGYGIYDLEIDA